MTVSIRTDDGDLVTPSEFAELEAGKRANLARRHGLTVGQLDLAQRAGIAPADAAAWLKIRNADDYALGGTFPHADLDPDRDANPYATQLFSRGRIMQQGL